MKYKHWLLLVIVVNALGLFSGILEPDGALYAYIAKQMAQHNDRGNKKMGSKSINLLNQAFEF